MSSKKEEKSQVAAEKIKAQALSAAKGLSRAQAERAATAAARNVNAYGQKEEGPSRWQERKEAKRQMYLMSTEKAVRLGERKDLKASSSAAGSGSSQCQKCLQVGHWTFECKNERVYVSRPSRSQQLKNPARMKLVVSFEGNSDVQRRLEQEEQERKAVKEAKKSSKQSKRRDSKRKHRSESYSGSDTSEASVFESGSSPSASDSDGSSEESSSTYSSSESEDRRRSRRKKPQKKKRHRKYSSSSDSSESDSASDSDSADSDRGSRRKTKRRSRRH